MLYTFGSFELDLTRYELRAAGRLIHLQPRQFDLLRYLVEQAPRAVSKEELLERVWADAHTSEGVLTQAVSQLRRSLGDGDDPIETVRGRGYRLAASVERPAGGAEARHAPATSRPHGRRRRLGARALALAAAAALGALAIPPSQPAPSPRAPALADLNPLAVAVLPFEDANAEGSAYLGDALAEEVMHSLERSTDVLVVARTSAFAFRGSNADVQTIGRQLGVAHVLEGTVRRDGERLRVTAELVDARTGFGRWSNIWEGRIDELFAVQQAIAREVAGQVAQGTEGVLASGDGRVPRDFPVYDAYLRGMAAFRLRDRASLLAAVAHFETALAQDPDYADAWAGLASALGELWVQYSSEPRGGPLKTRAESAARRALELDPENVQAMRILADPLAMKGDEAGARALFARAAALRPSSVELQLSLGSFLLRLGEFDGALRAFETAQRADPFSAITNLQLGRAYFYAGDPDAALRYLDRAAELNRDYPRVAAQRAIVLRALGRDEESREAFLQLLPGPARPISRALARILGNDRFARLLFALGELRTGDPCSGKPEFAAHVYAAIGAADDMFTCLRREVLARHPWYIAVEPIYDPYRDDPRFVELLEITGLGPPVRRRDDGDPVS